MLGAGNPVTELLTEALSSQQSSSSPALKLGLTWGLTHGGLRRRERELVVGMGHEELQHARQEWRWGRGRYSRCFCSPFFEIPVGSMVRGLGKRSGATTTVLSTG